MTRNPKMILEVLEAIAEYFKADPEIATDCYLYLASSLSDARYKTGQEQQLSKWADVLSAD